MKENSDKELCIFISCVSDEFHAQDPSGQKRFTSYRDSLAADLRRSRIKHVVQEDLVQGFGDLLQTLDEEIVECALVVHLIGDMAGSPPTPDECRRFRLRHPQLFAAEPILSGRTHDETPISYTQWELYLAYLHGTKRLVFVAADDAPRSPAFRTTPDQVTSQMQHRHIVEALGEHREEFLNPDNLCRKVMTTLVGRRMLAVGVPVTATEGDISKAREEMPSIAAKIRDRIKLRGRETPSVSKRSSAHDLLHSIENVAQAYNIASPDLIGLLHEYQAKARAVVDRQPTPAGLVEFAHAQLACGEYEQAVESARKAARCARDLITTDATRFDEHRQSALNAYLLLADAATASHHEDQALQGMREGGELISKSAEPVFWAEYHEQIAKTLMLYARYAEADQLIRNIIDLREQHLGEHALETNAAHMLLGRLLYRTGKYLGAEVVATRVLRSLSSQESGALQIRWEALELLGEALEEQADYAGAEDAYRKLFLLAWASGPQSPSVATACSHLAWVLRRTGLYGEAETLFRQSLEITEKTVEPNSLSMANAFSGLANVLRDTKRYVEAEALFRRALAIEEIELGSEHPQVGTTCYEIAKVLRESQRGLEASEMFRRALIIDEKALGPTHPFVGVDLVHLAQALSESGRIDEAEVCWARGSVILEERRDSNHHRSALAHWHLAEHRERQGRYQEALREIQHAVRLLTSTLGIHHPDTCRAQESLSRIERLCQEHT